MKSLALLAVALVAAAGLAAATGSASGPGTRTLELVSVEKQFFGVPEVGPGAPPQVGGRLFFTDLNYNRLPQFGKPAGALVGRAEGVCTLVSASRPPQAQCLITAHVPDGQLVVAGTGDPAKRITRYAVVGGIGAYANARGTVTSTAISETRSLIVVHLES
jgi:dirigent-like protein